MPVQLRNSNDPCHWRLLRVNSLSYMDRSFPPLCTNIYPGTFNYFIHIMLSKLSLVWHLRRGLWRYWEIFYHVTFYKTRDLGHVPGADHCNSVARSPQDTMFVTPAKRKGDDLGESSNKKVKDESSSGATPYAKIQYYQVLWYVGHLVGFCAC